MDYKCRICLRKLGDHFYLVGLPVVLSEPEIVNTDGKCYCDSCFVQVRLLRPDLTKGMWVSEVTRGDGKERIRFAEKLEEI